MADHEAFRYLIPGVVFVLPVVIAASFVLYHADAGLSVDQSVATVSAVALFSVLPVGWLIYQVQRVYWLLWNGGYDHLPFVEGLRRDASVFLDDRRGRVYVSFAELLPDAGIRWFTLEEYQTTFDPFDCRRAGIWDVGYHGSVQRAKRAKNDPAYQFFLEHVSDLLMFKEASYDYARSVSSVRYGLAVSGVSLLAGLTVSLLLIIGATFLSGAIAWSVYGLVAAAPFLALAGFGLRGRHRTASAEYLARLTLLTVLRKSDRQVSLEEAAAGLAPDTREALLALPLGAGSYAALDMDNTLFVGDVQDETFQLLVERNALAASQWEEYGRLLARDYQEAYDFAARTLLALPEFEVRRAAIDAVRASAHALRVHPEMRSLVMALRLRGVQTIAVTASAAPVAKAALGVFFGFRDHEIIAFEINRDIQPIGEGKRRLLASLRHAPPVAVAGDGKNDLGMAALVEKTGVVFWLGASLPTDLRAQVVRVADAPASRT